MEQIMNEVFPEKAMRHDNSGRWFYAAFNMLFLMGYKPETSYEPRHSEKQIVPDEEYLDFLMEKKLNDVKLQIQLHKVIWDPQKRGV